MLLMRVFTGPAGLKAVPDDGFHQACKALGNRLIISGGPQMNKKINQEETTHTNRKIEKDSRKYAFGLFRNLCVRFCLG